MNFADCALQKSLASLAMPPKKAEHAGVQNSRNIFALLKQKPTPSVCDDSDRTRDDAVNFGCQIRFRCKCFLAPETTHYPVGPRAKTACQGLSVSYLRMSPTIAPPCFRHAGDWPDPHRVGIVEDFESFIAPLRRIDSSRDI